MNLTPHEQRILEASFRLVQARKVAAELNLSVQTVRNARHIAFKKLGVHSLIEAWYEVKETR